MHLLIYSFDMLFFQLFCAFFFVFCCCNALKKCIYFCFVFFSWTLRIVICRMIVTCLLFLVCQFCHFVDIYGKWNTLTYQFFSLVFSLSLCWRYNGATMRTTQIRTYSRQTGKKITAISIFDTFLLPRIKWNINFPLNGGRIKIKTNKSEQRHHTQ